MVFAPSSVLAVLAALGRHAGCGDGWTVQRGEAIAGCGRRAGLEEGPVGVCVEVQRVVVYGMRSTQAVEVA